MKVHTFGSTGEAYDASQCDDDIKDGDILHVPSEGVTGFLCRAWPTAVTKQHGAFHTIAENDDGAATAREYAASINLAMCVAEGTVQT